MLYQFLPPPDLAGVQNPPVAFILTIPGGDPGLPPQDQFLFGTDGTGLPNNVGPDTRITNVNALSPGPFQMTVQSGFAGAGEIRVVRDRQIVTAAHGELRIGGSGYTTLNEWWIAGAVMTANPLSASTTAAAG